MPEEDQATAIGNIHKKNDKDHAWFWRYSRRETDSQTHTQMYSSQYFTATPMGDVISTVTYDLA